MKTVMKRDWLSSLIMVMSMAVYQNSKVSQGRRRRTLIYYKVIPHSKPYENEVGLVDVEFSKRALGYEVVKNHFWEEVEERVQIHELRVPLCYPSWGVSEFVDYCGNPVEDIAEDQDKDDIIEKYPTSPG
jgi:hypothetical protein